MSTRSSSPSTYRAPTSLREAFRMHLGTEYAENTINAYVAAITQFYHFLNGLNPLRATMNHIRAYLFYLIHELGYAAQTYNQHFYGLRAFYETFMPDVPIMDAFGRRRTPQGDIKVVSRFEFERMVSRTDKNDGLPMRDYPTYRRGFCGGFNTERTTAVLAVENDFP